MRSLEEEGEGEEALWAVMNARFSSLHFWAWERDAGPGTQQLRTPCVRCSASRAVCAEAGVDRGGDDGEWKEGAQMWIWISVRLDDMREGRKDGPDE